LIGTKRGSPAQLFQCSLRAGGPPEGGHTRATTATLLRHMLDLDNALNAATLAATEAGKLILDGLKTNAAYTIKSDSSDRVTQADFDSQRIIQNMLAKEFPDIAFLGEEENSIPNSQFLIPNSCWIVDPLDGTMNFTHRMPFCGVMIALELKGEIVLGVLHFPAFDWTYTAVKGGGAKKNGTLIHVSKCKAMKDAVIAEIFSDRETRGKMAMYPPCSAYRKFGSAITSLAFLAEGTIDGTALRCRIWDYAAGKILIEEAGGTVSVKSDNPEDPRSVVTCLATVPEIHAEFSAFTAKAFSALSA